MSERRNSITSRQFMTFIISAQVGVGMFTMPYRLASTAGHDGWITIVLTCFSTIVLCILLIKLLERYKDKSIFEIDTYIYGKFFGAIINIAIILYLSLKGILALRFLIETTQVIILPLTPPLILTAIIFIPSLYLSWYGLKATCRFSNLIYLTMLAVVILLVMQLKFIRIEFLLPVGASGLPSIMGSIPMTSYSFLAFGNIAIIYPYITDKDKTLKFTISAIIISSIFLLMVTVVTTGFFGENMEKNLLFPVYSLAQSYRSSLFERIDILFFITWFPALAMTLKMYFLVPYNSINKLMNIKRTTISLIVLTLAFTVLSRIPKGLGQIQDYVEASEFIGIPMDYGLVILNLILSFIRKKGVIKSTR